MDAGLFEKDAPVTEEQRLDTDGKEKLESKPNDEVQFWLADNINMTRFGKINTGKYNRINTYIWSLDTFFSRK